jgi:hypothetical protein
MKTLNLCTVLGTSRSAFLLKSSFYRFLQLITVLSLIQKNTEALSDAGKEVGLEVNSEKTKYMLMSRKKAGQKHDKDSE